MEIQPIVPTDQWLTTRVDRTWTVSQVKHHMLTKIWGGRRYQLTLPPNLLHPTKSGVQEGQARAPDAEEDGTRRISISSSVYSSVVFASSIQGDHERVHRSSDNLVHGPSASPERSANSGIPDGGRTPPLTKSLSSTEFGTRGRSGTPSSSHRRGETVSGQRQRSPSNLSDTIIRDLRREEAMDRLYERMEASVRRRVLKAAKNYRIVSFSNVGTHPEPILGLHECSCVLIGKHS